jgi:uncharacterized cupredoxin-like copper-binding protein
MRKSAKIAIFCAACFSLAASVGALAHGAGETFRAGEPGNDKRFTRTVEVVMSDADGHMRFTPDRLDLKLGDEVRFVIRNRGALRHEFVIGDRAENQEHAAMMAKMPDMKHDDPNAQTVEPGKSSALVWRFSRKGEFEFACLIPGHYDLGMHGVAVVK